MKNRAIEFYRFIFTSVIVLYHFRGQLSFDCIPTGYIVVEFFFILSGFLIAQGLEKYEIGGVANFLPYIKRRINRLYPHYFFSLAIYFLLSLIILKSVTIKSILVEGHLNFFMLQMLGFKTAKGNPADWYVSSLFIATFLLSFLILKYKKEFREFLAPIISIAIYLALYINIGHLGSIRETLGLTFTGTLRGIAGMSLGVFCHTIYSQIKEKRINQLAKLALTFIEIACIAVAIYRIINPWKTKADFIMVPVFFILILSVFTKESYLSKIFDNKISQYLGSISYAMYLNHSIIRELFKQTTIQGFEKAVWYYGIVIFYSAFTTWLIGSVTKRLTNRPNRIDQ